MFGICYLLNNNRNKKNERERKKFKMKNNNILVNFLIFARIIGKGWFCLSKYSDKKNTFFFKLI